jgi:hypothetical protein
MRTIRGLLALAFVVALAFPATVMAQSAGDEQYTDPFQGQNGGGGNGGGRGDDTQAGNSGETQGGEVPSGGDTSSGATGTTESGTTTGSTTGSTTASAAGSVSPTLPVTGGPATMLAAIGAGFLLAGLALRRRFA